MEIYLKTSGIILIAVSLIHLILPKRFNWKEELQNLSLFNKQMMQVHIFFIALIVFLIGILLLTSTHELTHTTFGKKIMFGILLFFGLRALCQFFVYSPKLWKGKSFKTIVHIIFSTLWVHMRSILFIAIFL